MPEGTNIRQGRGRAQNDHEVRGSRNPSSFSKAVCQRTAERHRVIKAADLRM
jgi:hypothetical protein